jgi:hypothetical protein
MIKMNEHEMFKEISGFMSVDMLQFVYDVCGIAHVCNDGIVSEKFCERVVFKNNYFDTDDILALKMR